MDEEERKIREHQALKIEGSLVHLSKSLQLMRRSSLATSISYTLSLVFIAFDCQVSGILNAGSAYFLM